MDSHNKETTSNYDATWLALNMYKTFAEELITYLSNTVKNLNAAIMLGNNPKEMYLKGKSDAFKELVDIIAKEYKLAKSDCAYSYLSTSEKKTQSIFEKNTKEYLFELQHKKIKAEKNEEVDRLFPDNKYRGRGNYEKFFNMKGSIANLLEYYGIEGFRMGMLCEKMLNETKFKELPKDPTTEQFLDVLKDNVEMVELLNKKLKFEQTKDTEDFSDII